MEALSRIKSENILFIDIETATVLPKIEISVTKDTPTYDAWAYYCKNNDIDDVEGSYLKKAALFAEFSKVVCVTVGVYVNDEKIIKTIRGEEEQILRTLSKVLEKKGNYVLCGHYIKGFDIPFLMKRYIVNGMWIPKELDVSGKKPWEITHLDTAELWKGSGWNRSSLTSICLCLGIPTPKQKFDGSDVSRIYHEGGIDDIVEYCERDVDALIKVYERLI